MNREEHQQTLDEIDRSAVFVFILHETDRELRGARELQVNYAIETEKPIIVWRQPGRENLPIPQVLLDYPRLAIADGGPQVLSEALHLGLKGLGINPGDDTINLVGQGYDAEGNMMERWEHELKGESNEPE